MKRTEALKLALNALLSRKIEADQNAKLDFIPDDIRQFWQQEAAEAVSAYAVLISLLTEVEAEQGGYKA